MGIYIMIAMGVFLVGFGIWFFFFKGPDETSESLLERDDIAGEYENLLYQGDEKNDWHYVTIKKSGNTKYIWKNRAGVSWTLTRD